MKVFLFIAAAVITGTILEYLFAAANGILPQQISKKMKEDIEPIELKGDENETI